MRNTTPGSAVTAGCRRGPRLRSRREGGIRPLSPSGGQDMPLSKRGVLSAFGALALILFSAASPDAAPPTREKRQGRPNLDARSAPAVNEKRDQLAANPSAAVKALGASLGAQGITSIDGLTGTPRIVARLDGFLTSPSGRAASRIALDYVRAHADVFKVDVSTLELAREYVSVDGTRHIWWRQVIN